MTRLALALMFAATSASAQANVRIKLGTMAPQGSTWHQQMISMAEEFSKASGGKVELKIPHEDGVKDWSSDGRWLLTTSSRGAKFGWQLYVMRLVDKKEHRITDLTVGQAAMWAHWQPK